ncbi:hypothetical protein CPB84DRAFT_1478990 [Gymnopilus junonius]|uniref:Uncharacterized protein n=1 Tax=Gymnopilus junonius TaxID=109634 RepID=A0A9P5NJ06_GYMJU|nr:hypothetical protein CPB84DRAFT_1478990 [Gymnopilus junonius]
MNSSRTTVKCNGSELRFQMIPANKTNYGCLFACPASHRSPLIAVHGLITARRLLINIVLATSEVARWNENFFPVLFASKEPSRIVECHSTFSFWISTQYPDWFIFLWLDLCRIRFDSTDDIRQEEPMCLSLSTTMSELTFPFSFLFASPFYAPQQTVMTSVLPLNLVAGWVNDDNASHPIGSIPIVLVYAGSSK